MHYFSKDPSYILIEAIAQCNCTEVITATSIFYHSELDTDVLL